MTRFKSWKKTACLGVFILAASTLPLLAQRNMVEVKCLDTGGNPVNGMRVELTNVQTGKSKDKKTNREGIALFDKVDDGVYRVVAREEGYSPAFYEFLKLQGDQRESVTLTLESGSPERSLYFENNALNDRAFGYLQQGVEAMRARNFEEAEKLIQQSLEINPSSPEARYNLAIAYLQQAKWDAAEVELKKAAELIDVYLVLTAERFPEGQNPYQQVGQQINQLLGQLPIFRLRTKGDTLLSQQKYAEAIQVYDELLQIDPGNPDHYYNKALAQAHSKEYDAAEETIGKALELKPDDQAYQELQKQIDAYQEREVLLQAKEILSEGDERYNSEDFRGALEKYYQAEKMLANQPLAVLWAQIARAHAKLNENDKALQAYRKVLELEPAKTEYWQELAQFHMEQGDTQAAIQTYMDMYKASSMPVDVGLFNLAKQFSAQGKNDTAALLFEKVVEINPHQAEAYYELGMYYFYQKQDKAKAKTYLNKYLESGSDEAHLDNARSVLAVMDR